MRLLQRRGWLLAGVASPISGLTLSNFRATPTSIGCVPGRNRLAAKHLALAPRLEAPAQPADCLSDNSNCGNTIHVASSRVNRSICCAQKHAHIRISSPEHSALRCSAGLPPRPHPAHPLGCDGCSEISPLIARSDVYGLGRARVRYGRQDDRDLYPCPGSRSVPGTQSGRWTMKLPRRILIQSQSWRKAWPHR